MRDEAVILEGVVGAKEEGEERNREDEVVDKSELENYKPCCQKYHQIPIQFPKHLGH